ncbi:DegT/DnrJ/EryC1/StrS family aminotransferase [Salirhabdus sp. Marseille-P4669]|uniref:DegT/DnrJ/EryC1/StrS family aminotransferase n=1 Tax=Salirhabdus sp. Marseille-P4669 TaxID=2042310 RepID=UPI001F2EE1C2|nr:DegT/DnrJ/EryC1/StrS family aminotransferase [Salirhabdus sp. Marseille-P4669]
MKEEILLTKVFEQPIYVTRPLLPNKEEVYKKIDEIWESKWITNNGRQLRNLEEKLKNHLKINNISLFNNGTMALILGLKSLNLRGEVITTPFTFPATTQALDWNNLTPIFCDIEPDTLNINADLIEPLITENTSAILAVHVFGNPCEVEKIQQVASKYNLKVIYDAAHAFGTIVNGKPIGSYGDMSMFSFHATKLFNTIEGGALTFNDNTLSEKLELLKNFGLKESEKVILSGLNAKMNEIQAAIGLEVLNSVEIERLKRDKIKRTYETHLQNIPGIRIITRLEKELSSYQYFVIEVDEVLFGKSRDWLQKELEKYNIYTRKYFYPLCSDFYWYKNNKSADSLSLPQAYKSVNQVLALPYYGDLSIQNVITICEIIRDLHINLN